MVGGWEDPSQAPPGGPKFRDAARWLAHHTIGTATATRYEPLIEGYKAAIEQMARLETTWTATIGTGQPHSVLVKLNPSAPDTVRRFNAELFEAARAHRIPWIDHDAVPHDSSHDAGFVDFIHRNAAWHERIAAELFAAISVPAGVSR
jgi:hypothetical protein